MEAEYDEKWEKYCEKWAATKWRDPKTEKTHTIIAKKHLKVGHYYIGKCRNARVARWDGKQFWYWRNKFGSTFLEPINHPEDDDGYDLFMAEFWLCDETGNIEIPLDKG